ncbi:MAG: transporter substrate-binding domain-containing protein [Rhodanobacteraceae bacterium]|nr:MAG: transporter substrate-binding domain-containing protein [Rhodanobacteraceae bacterium]
MSPKPPPTEDGQGAAMKYRWPVVAVVAVGLLAGAMGARAEGTLRVCSDPAYLPYSDRAGQGFENAAARIVADALHDKLEYTWYDTRGKGGFSQFLSQTLDKGECDVVMSLPYGSQEEQTTNPWYVSSYVFIFKKSKGYDITSLDSPALHRLKIGFESETPIETGLQLRGMVTTATPFDVAGTPGESPRAMLQAVQDGKVDVMITWEPSVGAFLKDYPDLAVVMVPNERDMGPPEQYTFPMAMGVREGNKALLDQLNGVIKAHQDELTRALEAHGVHYPGAASGSPSPGVAGVQ